MNVIKVSFIFLLFLTVLTQPINPQGEFSFLSLGTKPGAPPTNIDNQNNEN